MNMNNFINTRFFYLSIFLVCGALLGVGLYLQHAVGLQPCPLCVFQRIAFISIGLIALIAAIHGPGIVAGRIYGALIALTALTGGAIAGRQVWLQHLPADQIPECGPGLDYMLDAFPFTEALRMVLSGSGECAEVQWRFLELSIPEWSLLWFLAFVVAGLACILHELSR